MEEFLKENEMNLNAKPDLSQFENQFDSSNPIIKQNFSENLRNALILKLLKTIKLKILEISG